MAPLLLYSLLNTGCFNFLRSCVGLVRLLCPSLGMVARQRRCLFAFSCDAIQYCCGVPFHFFFLFLFSFFFLLFFSLCFLLQTREPETLGCSTVLLLLRLCALVLYGCVYTALRVCKPVNPR